jgi:Ca2+/Na+ antiporter
MERREGGRLLARMDPYLLLTLLLTVFALGPLLQPGYFWGAHDARHNVYFLFEFDRSIQDGIWYPRWAPDFTFGYGYPFFNVYGPLAYYVGEVFHLLGFDFVSSVKIVLGLSIVFSGLAMYLFVRRLMGPKAGLVAALVYVYVPYHVFDLYVRAALAESVTFVFVPLVLWGCYEAVQSPRLTNIVGLGLAYAGLMFTNNLVWLLYTFLVVPAYLIMLVLAQVNRDQPLRELSKESFFPFLANLLRISIPPLAGLLLGLGLSAIFWIPMATEFKYVRVDQWYAGRYDYRDDFVYFFQLFSPTWGFGASGPGPGDTVSFQLGAVPFVLSALSLAVLKQVKDWALRRQILFFLAVTLIAIFLLLPAAVTTWELLSPVRFAQFPWRYLTFTVLSTAVLAGSIVHEEPNSQSPISNLQSPISYSLLILVTLVILGSYPYLQAEITEPAEGPVSLAGLMRFQQSADEMTGSTAWVKEIPEWSPMADNYIAGLPVESKLDQSTVPEGAAAAARDWSTIHEFVQYKAPIRDEKHFIRLTFNLFYYPGWRAYLVQKHDRGLGIVGEVEIEPEDGPLGRITVEVPGNRRYLLLRFEDTPVRVVGKVLSALSLGIVWLAWGGTLGWRKMRTRRWS